MMVPAEPVSEGARLEAAHRAALLQINALRQQTLEIEQRLSAIRRETSVVRQKAAEQVVAGGALDVTGLAALAAEGSRLTLEHQVLVRALEVSAVRRVALERALTSSRNAARRVKAAMSNPTSKERP